MAKLIRDNQKGFTLIELMIVVAIMGILAAIAGLNFLNYHLRAKTAEAKANIGAIRTFQENFKAEHGIFQACTVSPAGGGGPAKTVWAAAGAAGASFDDIGYSPAGSVFYQYEVSVDASKVQMVIGAASDLDGDTKNGEFGLATDFAILDTTGVIVGKCTVSGQIQDLAIGHY